MRQATADARPGTLAENPWRPTLAIGPRSDATIRRARFCVWTKKPFAARIFFLWQRLPDGTYDAIVIEAEEAEGADFRLELTITLGPHIGHV